MSGRRQQLPKRIGLCPEHADEFYYPLRDGERATCPQCSLNMVVYLMCSQGDEAHDFEGESP